MTHVTHASAKLAPSRKKTTATGRPKPGSLQHIRIEPAGNGHVVEVHRHVAPTPGVPYFDGDPGMTKNVFPMNGTNVEPMLDHIRAAVGGVKPGGKKAAPPAGPPAAPPVDEGEGEDAD